MSSIVLPSQRIAQPCGASDVDWVNPITSGFTRVYNIPKLRDEVKKANLVLNGTKAPSVTGLGLGLKFSALGDYIADNPAALSVTANAGSFGILWVPHDITSADQYVMSMRQGTTGSRYYLRNHAGAVQFGWAGAYNLATTASWTLDKPSLIILSWSAANNAICYFEGLEVGSSTAATEGAPDSAAIAILSNDANYRSTGTALIAFVRNRPTTALEAKKLSDNPWQLLKKTSNRIWFDSAVGGGTHTTTGAITGQGATVAGTSTHLALHTTSGTITGQGAVVAGVAVHPHTTSGVITGQGATVAGVAVHPHTTTGTITGQGATVAGASEHTAAGHDTSGTIVGQGATVAGVSTHLTLHTTTGDIIGQGATVAGTSTHLSLHTTTGAITGQGATVAGVAVNGFPTSIVEQFSGGYEYAKLGNKRRTKDDIAKARKEYGLAFDVIEKVAIRQSKQLLTDEQKIYDELSRELTLKGLEIESKHIELLNLKKEKLVNDEIAMLLKKQEKEDKQVLAMMVEIVEQDKQNFINKMIELQHKFTAAIGV